MNFRPVNSSQHPRSKYTTRSLPRMFGRETLEAVYAANPGSQMAKALLDNFKHFESLHYVTGGWHHGWGSYLFNGQAYTYQKDTFKKQEALFNAAKNAKEALEIGVYLGHSLLLMLLANDTLRITCIDNDSKYPPYAVDYLNRAFGNRITFILSDAVKGVETLPDNTFDLIHIDADHYDHAVNAQFHASRRVAKEGATVVFDDYEAVRKTIDGFAKDGLLEILHVPWCLWTNCVGRLTPQTRAGKIVHLCRPFSALSTERLNNNINMVDHVNATGISGDIVEIGIYKGGSMLAMMKAHEGSTHSRKFHLYDTFTGMTEPTEADVDLGGYTAKHLMNINHNVKCICDLDTVRSTIQTNTTIPESDILYHVGDILQNTEYPESIAVLRLDTDWYESTAHELRHFYPLVTPGGVVIVDDYGHWKGSRKAVDEFLADHPGITIHKIDYTGIYFFKPANQG